MATKKTATKGVKKTTKPAAAPKAKKEKARDPRLPAAGETIVRPYKGRDITVLVGESDFSYEGEKFTSLTAIALKVTGYRAISGPAFFHLDKPKAEAAAK